MMTLPTLDCRACVGRGACAPWPFPDPVPRIRRRSPAVTRLLALPWVRRGRMSEGFALAVRRAPRAATVTRIACRRFGASVVSGGHGMLHSHQCVAAPLHV